MTFSLQLFFLVNLFASAFMMSYVLYIMAMRGVYDFSGSLPKENGLMPVHIITEEEVISTGHHEEAERAG